VTAVCATLYCERLYYVRFDIVGLQAARCPVRRPYGIVDTRDTCAVSRYFFCYDIPRYIVTKAILVSSLKYRR